VPVYEVTQSLILLLLKYALYYGITGTALDIIVTLKIDVADSTETLVANYHNIRHNASDYGSPDAYCHEKFKFYECRNEQFNFRNLL
jgi:hypothetical protein